MKWTTKDNKEIEISYSQKLQRMNLIIMLFVAILLVIITLTMFGVLYKIDSMNFLTAIMSCTI